MASIRKHAKGNRAQIDRLGIRKSKVFVSRQVAKDWAAHEEYKILHGEKLASAMRFGEVFERYAREVSPQKRGQKWEVMQIERLLRGPLASVALKDLSASHFSDWRDVAAGTIRREKNLLSADLGTARKEWGLIHTNPLEAVRMPPEPRPRESRPLLMRSRGCTTRRGLTCRRPQAGRFMLSDFLARLQCERAR